MELNDKEAFGILMKGKALNPTGSWVEHSLRVGEAAGRIAEVLKINESKAKALGYIHDIGKIYAEPYSQHVAKGYEYLKSLGISEEYANICLTHSYLNNDINCTAGGIPDPMSYKYDFRKEFIKNYKYNIYDKIIQCCDLLCTDKFMIMEERLIEIMLRRGVHENTGYHIKYAKELKDELDEKIGQNLYTLFPEIKKRIFD